MFRKPVIGIDFDGTVVDHRYPDIGAEVPGAVKWMRKFAKAGAMLILWTMRDGHDLEDAVDWFKMRKIKLYGVNMNPTQSGWTKSQKAYCQIYIDDASACVPLHENPRCGGRPYVDWDVVGPWVMEQIERKVVRV